VGDRNSLYSELSLCECTLTYKQTTINYSTLEFGFISDMKGKIRVYCRLRPLNEKEMAEKEREVLTAVDEFTVEYPWKDDKPKQYIYDRVFDAVATQESVFEDTKVSHTSFIVISSYGNMYNLNSFTNFSFICNAVFGAVCCRWL